MAVEDAASGGVSEQEVEERFALVAHELLGPLVVTKGYNAMLLNDLEHRDAEAAELARAAGRNLELAILLLQRLRDTGASSDELDLDRAELDLAEVVGTLTDDLAGTVAADHPLTFDAPDGGAVKITADEVRVRQILFNLLVNAAKYSDRGAPIEVNLTVDDGMAAVEVRNHGFGVAPEDAERLFEKGTRGPGESVGGLGVGLFISRVIAEAHGGSLHVEPAEVRGSRFILRLPLS